MIAVWPAVALGAVLTRSDEWAEIEPDREYRQVTVRLWGRGVVERAVVRGAEIAATRQLAVRAGQFILSRIDARNGALGIVPESLDGALVSSDFPAFNVNRDRVIPEFLGWLSKTSDFVGLCRAASEGTTNRVRLQEDRFLRLEIPLPPLYEQRRIAARIAAIAARTEEARGLRRAAEVDMEHALLGAYRQIVERAPRRTMGDVAPLVRRPISVMMDRDYPELGIRSFGKGTFHKPPITGADLGTKRIFVIEPGDLVFNIVFAWEGAVAVARPEDAGRVGSHRFLTCVPEQDIAAAQFLCYHFLTSEGLQQLGEASPGGAGRNRTLGLKALERIEVPVPILQQQEWFARLLRKAEELARLQAESAAELEALLPSVLDRAFRGEL